MGPAFSIGHWTRKRLAWMVSALLLFSMLPAARALTVNGVEYTELRSVAGNLGMKTRWVEKEKILLLESKWTDMRFEIHKREMFLNGKRLFMGYPVIASRGKFLICADDFNYLIKPILTPQLFKPVPGLRHIVIDAGHGGDDPGAENDALKLREKALTLDLSRKLEEELERHGFAVSMTRRKDVFIPLEERCQIANRLKADLFISVHFNATGKAEVSGLETYALTPPNQPSTSRSTLADSDRERYRGQEQGAWNTLLAYYVQRSMVDSLQVADRGLKRAQFTVLRELEMPGILVECGFVTHSTEGRNIGSSAYRDRLAKSMVEGILVYQRTLTRLRN